MSRHGRATIPFGKFKGVRIRLLPDDYLSFLTTLPLMKTAQWKWLWDSVIAELKFRGLKYDLAETEDPAVLEVPDPMTNKRKLRTEGLIEYPGPGMISMTPLGRRLAPKPETPISNREMYASCLRNLSGLEVRIFELLYRRYPQPVSRDEVSEKTDARGGYFFNTVGHLHSMEFVEYPKPGMLKCPDWVFVEN